MHSYRECRVIRRLEVVHRLQRERFHVRVRHDLLHGHDHVLCRVHRDHDGDLCGSHDLHDHFYLRRDHCFDHCRDYLHGRYRGYLRGNHWSWNSLMRHRLRHHCLLNHPDHRCLGHRYLGCCDYDVDCALRGELHALPLRLRGLQLVGL